VSESPFASVEAAPEKLTASGAVPLVGTPAATATGGVLGGVTGVVKLSGEAGGLGDVELFAAPSAEVTR
jgi:hypothetical protein